jgi:hypothetical protein
MNNLKEACTFMSFCRHASFLCSKHRQDAASHIERKKTKKEERIPLPVLAEAQKQHQRAGFFKLLGLK